MVLPLERDLSQLVADTPAKKMKGVIQKIGHDLKKKGLTYKYQAGS